jgi:glutamate racemase
MTRNLPLTASAESALTDSRPVGVFDSGVGGMNVLREIRAQLPLERCIYLADSREAPYGSKPTEHVVERCRLATQFLLDLDCKTIVVACNTASVVALQQLRAEYDVPFIGVVPAVKPAAAMTRSGRIGLLSTPATAESDPLAELIHQFADGIVVITQRCPGLVPLIERGIVDGPEIDGLLRAYLGPMLEAGVDVVVLGCTHFPFLHRAIERICGPSIRLIDPSDAVARQLGRILSGNGIASTGPDGSTVHYTTGDVESFANVVTGLLGDVVGAISHAVLERS